MFYLLHEEIKKGNSEKDEQSVGLEERVDRIERVVRSVVERAVVLRVARGVNFVGISDKLKRDKLGVNGKNHRSFTQSISIFLLERAAHILVPGKEAFAYQDRDGLKCL